jgi:hypothetical protein
MTGEEFQAALRTLSLTKAELSREIGVHRVTLQRYINGTLVVPKLLECYIELRLERSGV